MRFMDVLKSPGMGSSWICLGFLRFTRCVGILDRNQLRQLLSRAVAMVITFEQIGPLQEAQHTNTFHLIIEIIEQSMRWGPPSSVWCYVLERIIGHFVRGIKSKRHAEANIMNRYRNTLVSRSAFSNPHFEGSRTILSEENRASPKD